MSLPTRYVSPKCIAQPFEKAKQTTAYKETIRQIIDGHRDAIVIDKEVFLLLPFRRQLQDLATLNDNFANSDNYVRLII